MQKIIVILGPTAVGKSDLAVELALQFNGEIISADSRQVYTGLTIGTGKITHEEMRGVPHHLLDVIRPTERYTVTEWKEAAEKRAREIIDHDKLPIICGGTGLYIQAFVDNLSFPKVPPNPTLREILALKSSIELFELLKEKDPRRAKTIDENNPRRLIRALEIAESLGIVPELESTQHYEFLQIGLTLERDELRKRIHARLLKRLEDGMVKEVEALHRKGLSYARMDELGLEYRYLAKYLQKEMSLTEMKEKLEIEIVKYAKRQETWFKRDKRIKWFAPHEKKEILVAVENFIQK